MVSQLSIVRYLNSLLNIRNIPDASYNGIQVNVRHEEIKKIGFAVDATTQSLSKARKANCQMLICHHGIRWKRQRDVLGIRKKMESFCKQNKISLYAAHLPLDIHPEFGHNYLTAMELDLKDIKPFADYHGMTIGFMGKTKPRNLKSIAGQLDKLNGSKSKILPNKEGLIKTIGIVVGGGGSAIFDAHKYKLDLLITGEIPYSVALFAQEIGMNMILGGHYYSEQIGLKALSMHIKEKFNIQTQYYNLPIYN